jgi:hypothetical protein
MMMKRCANKKQNTTKYRNYLLLAENNNPGLEMNWSLLNMEKLEICVKVC